MYRLGVAAAAVCTALAMGVATGLAASHASPSVRLMFLVKSDASPAALPPSSTGADKAVCVGSWTRATVSAYGADRWRIKSVRFLLRGSALRVDSTSPYHAVLRDRLMRRNETTLRAIVRMRDGRQAELSRTVRLC